MKTTFTCNPTHVFFAFLVLCPAWFPLAQTVTQLQKITPADRETGDNFGFSMAVSGNFAVFGANKQDENALGLDSLNNAGSAYVYTKDSSGNWVEYQKIVASDRTASDQFGISAAIDDSTLIIGARAHDQDSSNTSYKSNAGAAYIFSLNTSGIWVEIQKITASDRTSNDYFGAKVAIDGNYILVQASQEDHDATGSNHLSNAASVYAFEQNALGEWNQIQKLVSPQRQADEQFGLSIAMNYPYALIGAPRQHLNENGVDSLYRSGAAYLFKLDSTNVWSHVKTFANSDRQKADYFGEYVALSDSICLISAYQNDYDEMGASYVLNAGAVYVFEQDAVTGGWAEHQKIVPSDRGGGDYFGSSVAISNDLLLVGARNEDNFTGTINVNNGGSAYLFKRTLNNSWEQATKFITNDRTYNDQIGKRFYISGTEIIGATELQDQNEFETDTLNNAGAVYVFDYSSCYNVTYEETKVCGEYIASDGTVYTSSINLVDTTLGVHICDSVVILAVSIPETNTSISVNGDTLVAISKSNYTYNWFDCANMSTVAHDSTNQFVIPAGGSYAVEINNNGCLDTSNCIGFEGVDASLCNIEMTVYPNPSAGQFTIESKDVRIEEVQLFNAIGEQIDLPFTQGTKRFQFAILEPGIYVLIASTKEEVVSRKLVVK